MTALELAPQPAKVESKKAFIAYLSGDGGCDYTMGCNRKVVAMKATTWEEADREAGKLFERNSPYCERIVIYRVSDRREFDIAAKRKADAEMARRKAAAAEEAAARKQYDELRRRFGGGGGGDE